MYLVQNKWGNEFVNSTDGEGFTTTEDKEKAIRFYNHEVASMIAENVSKALGVRWDVFEITNEEED